MYFVGEVQFCVKNFLAYTSRYFVPIRRRPKMSRRLEMGSSDQAVSGWIVQVREEQGDSACVKDRGNNSSRPHPKSTTHAERLSQCEKARDIMNFYLASSQDDVPIYKPSGRVLIRWWSQKFRDQSFPAVWDTLQNKVLVIQ